MTPDGITSDDWDRVRALAAECANASSADDSLWLAESRLAVLACLADLEHRYGPLPSILATRADYLDDTDLAGREKCLFAAYEAAESLNDLQNLVWISSSIAEFFAEEVHDVPAALGWLDRLELHLRAAPNAEEQSELQRLRNELAQKKSPTASP